MKIGFLWSLKPNSTLYTYTAQQHPLDFPHTMVKHRPWTPSELVKFLNFQRGKSKSISQKAELWIWRPWSPTSDLFHTSSTGLLLAPEQIHPDNGHLWWPSVHRGQSTFHCLVLQKTEPLSSLAAPIISLIPLTSATFIINKKVIMNPKRKKNHIYKVCTIYTSDFLWDTLHQKKEGHGSETSLPIKCCNY